MSGIKLPETEFIDGRGIRFKRIQEADHTYGYLDGTRIIVRGSLAMQRIFWRKIEEHTRLYDAIADNRKIPLPKGLKERGIA